MGHRMRLRTPSKPLPRLPSSRGTGGYIDRAPETKPQPPTNAAPSANCISPSQDCEVVCGRTASSGRAGPAAAAADGQQANRSSPTTRPVLFWMDQERACTASPRRSATTYCGSFLKGYEEGLRRTSRTWA